MPLTDGTEEDLGRLVADAAQIIARYPNPRSALLPMLHLVQSEEGYVSPEGIVFCAEQLDLTTAETAAVATFYTQYKRRPNGEYTVGVCINTLCAVMGGDAIYDALQEHLGVGHEQTTEDRAVTLERIECNAACDYAPVVMVNWEFFDNQTPASARDLVDELRAGRPVTPTRGADTVAGFKQVSRVLAGFDDGRADEGIGAGNPTQRGTRLAQQMGWTAPAPPRRSGAAKGTATPDGGTGTGGAGTAPVASSAHDAPAASPGSDRGGTTAGKPPSQATADEADPGSATDARPGKE